MKRRTGPSPQKIGETIARQITKQKNLQCAAKGKFREVGTKRRGHHLSQHS